MKLLIWHWGRRGGGPLFAARLAEAITALPGQQAFLSLAAGAEILRQPDPPPCLWPEPTYNSAAGFLLKRILSPALIGGTLRKLEKLQPDMAICAMPALLDGRMLAALKRTRTPYAAVVHDAAARPGEVLNFTLLNQRRLLRGAAALVTLSEHVANDLAALNMPAPIIRLWHPAFAFGPPAAPPLAHGGKPRLLFFGRLLAYKGIDLLAAALARFGPDLPFDLRICGEGPASSVLAALAARPGVTLERRWIAEAELPGLLAWSDGLILPYREASQSGVAAAALAAGRYVLATKVGGLAELTGKPGVTLCPPSAEGIADGFTSMFASPPPPLFDAAADWCLMASRLLAALSSVSAN